MMTDRNSIPRLHSVRFKDGRAPLRIFRVATSPTNGLRESFLEQAPLVVEQTPKMDGFVMVAWGSDASTTVQCATMGKAVPVMLMPEFVKTCVTDWVFKP